MSKFTDKFFKNEGFEYPSLRGHSRFLCLKYNNCFDEWWDPEEFNWGFSDYLIEFCSSDILTWFDKSKIDIWKLDPKSIVLLKKHNLI